MRGDRRSTGDRRVKRFDPNGCASLVAGSGRGSGFQAPAGPRRPCAARALAGEVAPFDASDPAAGVARNEAAVGAIDALVDDAGMQCRSFYKDIPVEELAGGAAVLASDATSLVNRHTLHVHGGNAACLSDQASL